MKKLLTILILIAATHSCFAISMQTNYIDSLYQMIDKKDVYMSKKEDLIKQAKQLLLTPNISLEQAYNINNRLYLEYQVYISDSAISYALQNVEIAQQANNKEWIAASQIKLATQYIVTGMYLEADEILSSYSASDLSPVVLEDYYSAYVDLNNNYSHTSSHTAQYKDVAQAYHDSLSMVVNPEGNRYQLLHGEQLLDQGNTKEAKLYLSRILDDNTAKVRYQAIAAYLLARCYHEEGNIELEKQCYALSGIKDIVGNIKENTATRALASTLYDQGDIVHAYKCVRSSMEDAMFCNARLRTYEVWSILPIIDMAYREKVSQEKERLRTLLILISILTLFLLVAIFFVYMQMKRLLKMRKELGASNDKLSDLNAHLQNNMLELNEANSQLSRMNHELSETNRIKETYITHFLDLCSKYINKLDNYQRSLNNKAAAKKMDELFKMLKSTEMINTERKELLATFDHIFLHLYPNFVEEFNELLIEEERFKLKDSETLNVELRIFALIRLGITDSSKIAQFLHYSANTIYSYRTRVRNKAAVPREEFEKRIMDINGLK